MLTEDDLLPISGLQHLLFCERQCALIHIERVWVENRLTVEGRHLHEKAHGRDVGPRGGGQVEARSGVRVARGMQLRSLRLGLYGVADVVEFHMTGTAVNEPSQVVAYPVEYKRGRPKAGACDRVQVCAQALCLEEMLGGTVPAGALFYGRTRRRDEVRFDTALRELTEDAASRLHALIRAGLTPRVRRLPKCRRCSLLSVCIPEATGPRRSMARFLDEIVAECVTGSSAGNRASPGAGPP